jgi:propanediol dehydratase small subunit
MDADGPALTVDAVLTGRVTLADVRIDPGVLEHQASVAEAHGNPQLADNLRRAAELARLADDRVLELYGALRPHRSSADDLARLAEDLDAQGARRSAVLVREAAATYERRGLLR